MRITLYVYQLSFLYYKFAYSREEARGLSCIGVNFIYLLSSEIDQNGAICALRVAIFGSQKLCKGSVFSKTCIIIRERRHGKPWLDVLLA